MSQLRAEGTRGVEGGGQRDEVLTNTFRSKATSFERQEHDELRSMYVTSASVPSACSRPCVTVHSVNVSVCLTVCLANPRCRRIHRWCLSPAAGRDAPRRRQPLLPKPSEIPSPRPILEPRSRTSGGEACLVKIFFFVCFGPVSSEVCLFSFLLSFVKNG